MSDETMTPEAIAKLARLARLDVTEQERATFARDLGKIVAYVQALQQVDTTGVEPTAHVLLDRLPLRDDATAPSLPREETLAQAPRHDDEGFRVPVFVDE